MYLKLAWRNLWRNRRRTIITMVSVFFGVILSSLLMSFKEGVYTQMIDSTIGSYMGFGQIHAKDYWEERTLDYTFEVNDTLERHLRSTPNIKDYLQRTECVAMVATDSITRVGFVIGIEPEKEKKLNDLHKRIATGSYLKENDRQVMLGKGLADYLKVGVGDTVILLGQGYQGISAAGKYRIKALINFGSPELSKQVVMLPLHEAQELYGLYGQINNLILHFKDPDNIQPALRVLQEKLGNRFEVMSWEELAPDIKNLIETDRMEGYVFMFILYLVISFGLFGTMLMMLAERRYEFGILVAVGMKRIRLAVMVWIEMITMSVLGSLFGLLGAIPVCYYFYRNPVPLGKEMQKMMEDYGMEAVMQTSMEPTVFLQQTAIIAAIACVLAIYPLVALLRFNALKGMKK